MSGYQRRRRILEGSNLHRDLLALPVMKEAIADPFKAAHLSQMSLKVQLVPNASSG